MPYIQYINKDFRPDTLATIEQANGIIEEYQAEGYSLTLRQLYYQFVARALLPNEVQSYKRLGGIISDGRLAGLIDWEAIEDRTRELNNLPHWNDAPHIVSSVARQFRVDRWDSQPYRIEVWIEKEALAGVFERVCRSLDVPYFSCRGYTSQSEMWGAAMRLLEYQEAGQTPLILHFGDHDPSGIDMTRDIRDRMEVFGLDIEVDRLALNMDQVEEWSPPPNPAKTTDSRYRDYVLLHGGESWELDALDPAVLAGLVRNEVNQYIDDDAWEESGEEVEKGRRILRKIANRWDDVAAFLGDDDE